MELLSGAIGPIYMNYLAAALGSSTISSVYSLVDMAMVGQYHGPEGTAALAVIAPVWNIIYSFGLLVGVGGSVLFAAKRGSRAVSGGQEHEYFTAAVIGAAILSVIAWGGLLLGETQMLRFFGGDERLLPLAQQYLLPIKIVFPLFLWNQLLAAFLRNDGNPKLAATAVLLGGLFNVVGDYVFVFALDMGIFGAGVATALGCCINFLTQLTHFAGKGNTLKLVRPKRLLRKLWDIGLTGFSTFFIDIAMGILTVLFNRQIMVYLDANALAVYGPIINISTLVQCGAYAIGNAAQPLLSTNFGAGNWSRIRETLRYALLTSAVMGVFWTALSLAIPEWYLRLFMEPTAEILEIGPGIIRIYAISFLLLPLNVFSTFYFQALLQPRPAFIVSIMRGLVISGGLLLLLPVLLGAKSLWFAMPITESFTMLYAVYGMVRVHKAQLQ